MLILLMPQGPAVAGVDLASVITDLLPALGASNLADLTWCTQDELYNWADEYAKRIGHRAGVFVERDTSTAVASGTASYSLPTGYIDAIHVSLAPSTRLIPSNVKELLAKDQNWQTATGNVERYSLDASGFTSITLYRIPVASGTLNIIYHKFPPQIQATNSILPTPSPVGDYLAYAILAEARRKQSEAMMVEMAQHFDERLGLYEQIIQQYWGAGQAPIQVTQS